MADQADRTSGSRMNRRRRAELRRIENEDARHVCFSKRRTGLFRKASELSTLCSTDIAIIINSPTGRPYSFGSPVLDPVINRFLSNTPNQPGQNPNYQVGLVNHLNQELMTLKSQLNSQLAKKPVLNERLKAASDKAPECDWLEKIEELNSEELARLFDTLCQAKSRALSRQYELLSNPGPVEATVAPLVLLNRTGNQFEPGSSNLIPRSINPNLVVGLNRVNPLNIPNPSPINGFRFGLINENPNPNNMIVPYQPSSHNLNQQGVFVHNSSNLSQNSTVQLSPMLIRFHRFNSDLVGSGRLNIGPSRFNPSYSGSSLDPTGLNPDSTDPNPGV